MGAIVDVGFDGTLPKKLLAVLVAAWVAWPQQNPAVWAFWAYCTYLTWRTWVQYKELRDYKKLAGTIDRAVKKARG